MYTIIKKIRAVLVPAERRALNRHVLLGVLISVLDILFLAMIVWLINITASHQQVVVAGYPVSDFVWDNLIAVAIGTVLLFGIKNSLGYLITQSQYRYSYRVAARLSNTKLMQYLHNDYFNYVNTDSSVYMYQIGQQPIEFSQYILSGLQQIIVQAALIALSVIAIAVYNFQLFLMVTVFILPPVLIVAWLIRKRIKTVRSTTRINSEKSLQHLKESLSAYIESHIYNKHSFFSDRYTRYQQQLNTNLANLQSIQLLPSRLFEVFAIAGIFIITIINSHYHNSTNLIAVGVFMAAAYKIIPGLVNIINYNGQIKAFEHALNNMLPDDEISVSENVLLPAESIQNIKFHQVKFSYKDRTIFNNLNFELSSEDFAGISGVSGRGKTTLINMLLGFIEPESGQISINGSSADKHLRAAHRERISYVKQSVLLLHDTILKNIILSDGEYDDARLNKALQITGLDALIAQYPEGIHQLITENGNNLSGGQRQRIMMARALYKDFDLLILDEPFNELDDASEQKILHYLKAMTDAGKIILFITHNQQSLNFCNKTINLHEA
ncbi:ATP-binding cassette domain-containing protein [Mucilaginibacter jinjuensis]|uniref:ABC transporter ATP-binding protein n=1 Tax=Mucilaginibacter jinjuensis TaxID=1176721 RepID=A0ABY7TE02_9SPHI|nr:ABC transporter ATP-binding protein [Mucilaginibacter jinjuensis]WCT14598.1 ABC transporter ATP-binding protein [Mucilaginibacter jinjuensis]